MKLFHAAFIAEGTWPDSIVYIHAPSLTMAADQAWKLLQSRTNTMFYQVEVWEATDGETLPDEIRRYELVETRGVRAMDTRFPHEEN
jgi:hypothetical protein